MSTVAQNLQARKLAITAELAAMTSTSSGGKPSYSINGQSVDHTAYRLSLYQELSQIDQLIAAAEGPCEITNQAVP